MARFCGGQSSTVTRVLVLLLPLLAGRAVLAQDLYERPVLVLDPGMHTATIWEPATDAAGRFVATGSYDKTVRIWSASDGKLLQTIRIPAGPDNIGHITAVAISPDGSILAVGGWTGSAGNNPLYLFDPSTGKMTGRVPGLLPEVTHHLVFSVDGRYLAAALGGSNGLRVFDREDNWSEAFRDENYGGSIYGTTFAGDGRLATASLDGQLRLYDRNFKLIVPPQRAPSGRDPYGVAFSPDGEVLAVGYADTRSVDLLDGHNLERLSGAETRDLNNGNLAEVAWSRDGRILFAAGLYIGDDGKTPVLVWDQAGRGPRRALATSACSGAAVVRGIVSLPADQLLVARGDPCLVVLGPDGNTRWVKHRAGAAIRDQQRNFAVSADGTIVDFGFEPRGGSPLRFDLRKLKLLDSRPSDGATRPPKQDGLSIEAWDGSFRPELNGNSIELQQWEMSRSLAVDPDNHRFVLGTSWWLRALDADGKALWKRPVPGEAWAVNITADGRLVVAAHDDGTIRWYNIEDGRELLALYVLGDRRNWVAWTPEGFYAATPGAYGVLRWHVNRGSDRAPETVPVSDIPRLNRADALPLVLQERETARALGIADLTAASRAVQLKTGAAKPPGARLHVLAIGISDYGDRAQQLKLHFASKDAEDVANALVNTQSGEYNKLGGLYAEVVPQYLPDDKANRPGIFAAFDSMQRNMAKGMAGQDLAVVMFSGHGAIIDKRFYLLPYGVDASTPAQIKATAISAEDFQSEVWRLAEHGRVLLLLDACHSGAVSADSSQLMVNADLLRAAMASSNVTVLTSSNGEEISREDESWRNGAFTKVLIEALSKDADENHDGVISMSELMAYLSRHLPQLTSDRQHPGLELRFEGNLFIAGL